MPLRELERERGLAVVEDEAVVLAELAAVAGRPQGGHLVVRDDRQLERALEAQALSGMPLRQHASALVHEREAAAEMARDDREELLEAAAVGDRLRRGAR